MFSTCRQRAAEVARRPFSFLGLYHPTAQLRGASAEADFVEHRFSPVPAERRKVLCDAQATREAALTGAGAVTHSQFSCHGVHETSAPQNSGLELYLEGGAELPEYARREQGRLTLADMQKIRLNARLVVMSVCESGIAGCGARRTSSWACPPVSLPQARLRLSARSGALPMIPPRPSPLPSLPPISTRTAPAPASGEAFRDTQRRLRHATSPGIAGASPPVTANPQPPRLAMQHPSPTTHLNTPSNTPTTGPDSHILGRNITYTVCGSRWQLRA